MHSSSRTRVALTGLAFGLLALPLVLAGGPRSAEAGAPPTNWTYRDKVHKFSLKMFRDYQQVPLKVDEETVVCRFRDPKSKGAARGTFDVTVEVVRVAKQEDGPVITGGEGPMDIEKLRERLRQGRKPKNAWDATFGRLRIAPEVKRRLNPQAVEFKEIKSKDKPKIPGKFYQVDIPIQGYRGETSLHAALAIFEKGEYEMGVFMLCGGPLAKQYKKSFERIAKSFKWQDSKAKDVESLNVLDGINITAKKRRQIENTLAKGWGVVVSPKKNYVVLYNTKEGRNHQLAKIIAKNIELIREQIYEKQFPPAEPIKTVCICRVCGDKKEYHAYGGPGGSAGYWSPGDEELVFYDASPSKKIDDNTVSVLYHEAFHQYIFYSVGNVAPHSWFNEGHGDYYAGAELKGKKFKIKPFQWRVGTVKNAIVQGPRPFTVTTAPNGEERKTWEPKGYTPLQDLVRFTQREYYSYPGVSYAQGWALIYFLREIVPKNKKYKAKWGHILDTYFDVLKAEVNKTERLRPRGLFEEEEDDEDEGDDDKGDDDKGDDDKGDDDKGDDDKGAGADEKDGKGGDTPPAKGEDEPEDPAGPDSKDGDSKDDDEKDGDENDGEGEEEGPPDPGFGPMQMGGLGPRAALEKAVTEAFKGIDWEEFEAAWIKATKRGK